MNKVYKINGHEVKFYYNEENRIVTASITHCHDDVIVTVENDFGLNVDDWGTATRFSKKIWLPGKMKCVAHCHPADEYNVEEGKKVAYKKLRKKYWSKFAKRMYAASEIFVYASTFATTQAEKALGRAESIKI